MSSSGRPRIVSLVPAATEIVSALGCADFLVGRSHECDHPDAVRNLPVLTSARVDGRSSSAAIDRGVRSSLVEGLSLFSLDTGLLDVLRPDLILAQDQCSVCAVSAADLTSAVSRAVESAPRLVTLGATDLDGLRADIRRIAAAIESAGTAGIIGAGERLIASLEDRIRDVARRADPIEDRPTVTCLEWLDPPMAAGHWTPELVSIAGGLPKPALAGRHSPSLSWPDLTALDPDILILSPCGFPLSRIREEAAAFLPIPEVRSLRAVREGRVALIDGNAYLSRPGPRLIDALEILAEILHPDLFSYGHPGWTRV